MTINKLAKLLVVGLALVGLATPVTSWAGECSAQDQAYDKLCQPSCGKLKTTTTAADGTNATAASPKIKSLIKTTPENFIARIIRNLLGLAGTMTMVMMVYGGLLWMTARGNTKTVGQAQKIIIWTAVGLVIIFSSYTVLSFLFNNLK